MGLGMGVGSKGLMNPLEDRFSYAWVRVILLEKYMFVSHTKHTQQKINRSTSFVIDNMHYVNFKI